jgi:hypothetical protein
MESQTVRVHLESSTQFQIDASLTTPLPSRWNEIEAALSCSISTPSQVVVIVYKNSNNFLDSVMHLLSWC